MGSFDCAVVGFHVARTISAANGCHNRPAFRAVLPVQDGWFLDSDTRTPRMVPWVIRAEPDCQYTLSPLGAADPGCVACKWRAA